MNLKKLNRPCVLVVDDSPHNIELLGETLMSAYDVRAVTSGPEALEIAHSDMPPDLILLDIMMPEMDGYEVCRRLKSHSATREIPIIFITARTEEADEAMGLSLGAVDYITKPFRLSVIKARVQAHLELKNHQLSLERMVRERTRVIEKAYRKLQQEIKERKSAEQQLQSANQALQNSIIQLRHAQEHLIQSEKMAALGGMVAGVAHEISTPVGISFTAASFLNMKTRHYHQLYQTGNLSTENIEKFMSLALESTEIIHTNLTRAGELITSFKQVGADQSSEEKRRFNFKQYLQTIIFSLQPKLKRGRHTITIDCPDDLRMDSYPGVFSQIITNLVINSVHHGFEGAAQKKIILSAHCENGILRFQYRDNGRGMTENQVQKIFDPFFTTKRNEGGTGLGMHIVYNLVTQTLKGQIRCESLPDSGTTFFIHIPLEIKDTSS